MSKVAIKGASTGTATFTIESPATNTDRTLNLPDGSGAFVLTDATQTLTNKTLTNPSYTGTLTGGTGVINIGSGQVYKDASGNVGIGTSAPARLFHVQGNNAIWRLDRDANTAALQIHRFPTGNFTTPWKGFLIGVEASASGNGALLFSDYGTAVTGAATERMRIDNSGQLHTKITGASNTVMEAYACRAWVNFNGTSINGSGNVSSVTVPGSGQFNVNFSTAMPDSSYEVQVSPGVETNHWVASRSTTSTQVRTGSGSPGDMSVSVRR
jgi:hypothetical protein